MPGSKNGIDLARWLRAERPDTGIVLATGFSAAAQQARDEGFFITSKPYELKTLEGLLVQSLQRARSRPRAARGAVR